MILATIMSMLGYFGAMHCVIEDVVRSCNPDSQGVAKATLWVIVTFAGVALFASILRDVQ